MLGLGLSLLGGAVMEDADGARAYFPAAAVRCNNDAGGTSVQIQAFSQVPVSPAAWDIDTMRGAFSCRILRRGARWAGWSFGCYSSYNDGATGNANYFFYSGLMLQPGGERNVTTTGNRSVLHYAEEGLAYTSSGYWAKPINSSALGALRFQLNGAALTGTAFGTGLNTTLPPMRVSAEYSRYSNLRLFAENNLDLEFYGSYWRDRSGAWQCLPMQSANGSAALFETTTQQLVEHESLSTTA